MTAQSRTNLKHGDMLQVLAAIRPEEFVYLREHVVHRLHSPCEFNVSLELLDCRPNVIEIASPNSSLSDTVSRV